MTTRPELRIDRLWAGAPAPPAEQATVSWFRDADALRIVVDAPFHDDPPPPGPPGPTPGLWDFEVVELFVLHDGGAAGHEPPRYTEIELGPHGHHLVLQLEGARKPVRQGLDIDYRAAITAVDGAARWRGEALVPAAVLPPAPHRGNAYAIHGVGAARQYLAHAPVPGDRPDFHRLACFVPLTL